jgi:hypothetical protein
MKVVLIRALVEAGMGIYLGILHFLLGRNSQAQHRTVFDTFHFYPGNGGPLSRVMELPFHYKIGLPFLEQTTPLNNITASNHDFLSYGQSELV